MIGSMGSKGGKGGKNGNKSEGGAGNKKGKDKPEMSVTSWRQLSPREREDFFGGVRPGSVKKKKLTERQKRDAMRGGN